MFKATFSVSFNKLHLKNSFFKYEADQYHGFIAV